MSKVFQSPGGSDSPASEPQSGKATPSKELSARLRLLVDTSCDTSNLAREIVELGRRLYNKDGDPSGLIITVLAERVRALAEVACSAAGDEGCEVGELVGAVYGSAELPDFTNRETMPLVAAVLAECATAQGGAA